MLKYQSHEEYGEIVLKEVMQMEKEPKIKCFECGRDIVQSRWHQHPQGYGCDRHE